MDFNWFVADVVDIMDPLRMGRVKIRAYPYHKTLSDDKLPWAQCLQPIQSAAADGIGISPTGIETGSSVIGFFLHSNFQTPMIMGTFAGKNDITPYATGATVELAEIGYAPASGASPQYPFNKVITTTSGHVIEIDDTKGAERILLQHASGTSVEINSDGRKVTRVIDDDYELIAKDKIVYVAGDITIAAVGNVKIHSNGEVSVEAVENINLSAPTITINDDAEPIEVPVEFTNRLSRSQEKILRENLANPTQYDTPHNNALGATTGAEVGPGPTDTNPQCSTNCTTRDIESYLQTAIGRDASYYRETGQNNNVLQLYRDVGFEAVRSDNVAWCAAFVGSVLKNTCHAYLPSLLAAAYDTYGTELISRNYTAAQAAVRNGQVRRGDILVFDRDAGSGHVAFFWGYTNGRIQYIGGNQSNTVCLRDIPLESSRLRSVRRPYRC